MSFDTLINSLCLEEIEGLIKKGTIIFFDLKRAEKTSPPEILDGSEQYDVRKEYLDKNGGLIISEPCGTYRLAEISTLIKDTDPRYNQFRLTKQIRSLQWHH